MRFMFVFGMLICSFSCISAMHQMMLNGLHYKAVAKSSLSSAAGLTKLGLDMSHERTSATPLLTAIRGSHTEMVELLVKCGARMSLKAHKKNEFLHRAIATDNLRIVRLLLDQGTWNLNYVIPKACIEHNYSIALLLFCYGAKIWKPEKDYIKEFVQSLHPLVRAVVSHDIVMLQYVLSHEVEDELLAQALLAAVGQGYVEMVRILMQHGAPVKSSFLDITIDDILRKKSDQQSRKIRAIVEELSFMQAGDVFKMYRTALGLIMKEKELR